MSAYFTRNILIYNQSLVLEQLLKQHLTPSDYALKTVHTLDMLYTTLENFSCDVLIVNTDRLQTVAWMEYGKKFPVLFLARKSEESNFPAVAPFSLLLKPLYLHTLIQTLNELLNKPIEPEILLQLNDSYILYPTSRILKSSSQDISLTEKEVALLQYLHSRDENISSKSELLQHIWGYNEHIDTHTLETHIYRLRQKIGEGEKLILTEENGYRLER